MNSLLRRLAIPSYGGAKHPPFPPIEWQVLQPLRSSRNFPRAVGSLATVSPGASASEKSVSRIIDFMRIRLVVRVNQILQVYIANILHCFCTFESAIVCTVSNWCEERLGVFLCRLSLCDLDVSVV